MSITTTCISHPKFLQLFIHYKGLSAIFNESFPFRKYIITFKVFVIKRWLNFNKNRDFRFERFSNLKWTSLRLIVKTSYFLITSLTSRFRNKKNLIRFSDIIWYTLIYKICSRNEVNFVVISKIIFFIFFERLRRRKNV